MTGSRTHASAPPARRRRRGRRPARFRWPAAMRFSSVRMLILAGGGTMSLAHRRVLIPLALIALGSGVAAPAARAQPGGQLHSYVLTFGPGDHPFFKFGHNAIWIR